MKPKLFGPTLLSFLSYLGVNLIFVVLPVILWFYNMEGKQLVLFVCLIDYLILIPGIIKDASWVKVTDVDISILNLFSSGQIKWKWVKKVIVTKSIYQDEESKSIEKGVCFQSRGENEVRVSTAMFSQKTLDEFYGFIYEKAETHGFNILYNSLEKFP